MQSVKKKLHSLLKLWVTSQQLLPFFIYNLCKKKSVDLTMGHNEFASYKKVSFEIGKKTNLSFLLFRFFFFFYYH